MDSGKARRTTHLLSFLENRVHDQDHQEPRKDNRGNDIAFNLVRQINYITKDYYKCFTTTSDFISQLDTRLSSSTIEDQFSYNNLLVMPYISRIYSWNSSPTSHSFTPPHHFRPFFSARKDTGSFFLKCGSKIPGISWSWSGPRPDTPTSVSPHLLGSRTGPIQGLRPSMGRRRWPRRQPRTLAWASLRSSPPSCSRGRESNPQVGAEVSCFLMEFLPVWCACVEDKIDNSIEERTLRVYI